MQLSCWLGVRAGQRHTTQLEASDAARRYALENAGPRLRTTVRDGTQMAQQNAKRGVVVDGTHIVWELLKEAATVSRIAYSSPPRSGLPIKSALPDGVDEVTVWQMISAYLRG